MDHILRQIQQNLLNFGDAEIMSITEENPKLWMLVVMMNSTDCQFHNFDIKLGFTYVIPSVGGRDITSIVTTFISMKFV